MKKIFLADDSLTIQKVVELTFPEGQYQVICASNGAQALQRIPEVVPDIALLDVIMPEHNGYEVCAQLKRTPELAWMPVLLLTGTFEPYDEKRATEAGAAGHLTKPFESRALVSRVEELLAASRRPGAPAEPPPAPAPSAPRAASPSASSASASSASQQVPHPRHEAPAAATGAQLGQTVRMKTSDLFAQVPAGTPVPRSSEAPRAPEAPRRQASSAGRAAAQPAPAAHAVPQAHAGKGSPQAQQGSAPMAGWGPQQQEAFERLVRQTLAALAPETVRRLTEEAMAQPAGGATPLGRHVHETIGQAAREIIAPIAEKVAREVAWEVIPDLAESLVRRRIRELEEAAN